MQWGKRCTFRQQEHGSVSAVPYLNTEPFVSATPESVIDSVLIVDTTGNVDDLKRRVLGLAGMTYGFWLEMCTRDKDMTS